MLQYRRALVSEVQDQVEPLAKKHLIETDKRLPDFADVHVNTDVYKEMERAGSFSLFVAEKDDVVVGYIAVYVMDTPHIIGYRQAVTDALYVDKAVRKYGVAQNLIKLAEAYAKDMLCSYMTLCFKADNPHKKFCNSIGYQEDDVMYSKSLEI